MMNKGGLGRRRGGRAEKGLEGRKGWVDKVDGMDGMDGSERGWGAAGGIFGQIICFNLWRGRIHSDVTR